MEDELDRAIKILSGKICQAIQPDHALKYTQAALNLAHVKAQLESLTKKAKAVGS